MTIHYEVSDHIATLTLDRPESLNALDVEDLTTLRTLLERARDDANVRVIIVGGAGAKSFCVGMDLKKSFPPDINFGASFVKSHDAAIAEGVYVRLVDLGKLNISKPLIAAINGYCLGGGLELALQCDIRIASHNASFGLPEPTVGSIPGVCGIQLLQRAVPSAIAMRMLLTGERIDADHAARVGLISDCVDLVDLTRTARELAATIAANGPVAIQMIKKVAQVSTNVPLTQAIEFTELAWGAMRDSEDRIEGRRAFAEKRRPEYKGR
ncbi:enoyl-CoA hydratase/isomerase family protein [Bordetella muralis]|uniref:enoyl-CoA hydratase/isomerase family protein n=1 Tax=Bordetella muralis TaxID=1649130 RepID=UPI0039EFC890